MTAAAPLTFRQEVRAYFAGLDLESLVVGIWLGILAMAAGILTVQLIFT